MRKQVIEEVFKTWNELTATEQEHELKLANEDVDFLSVFYELRQADFRETLYELDQFDDLLSEILEDEPLIDFHLEHFVIDNNSSRSWIACRIEDYITMNDHDWSYDQDNFHSDEEYQAYLKLQAKARAQAEILHEWLTTELKELDRYYPDDEEIISFFIANDTEFLTEKRVIK